MTMFGNLKKLWSQDMAIDLGTANTLVVLKGRFLEVFHPLLITARLYRPI